MTNLITAKEAFALSKFEENIAWHIKHISIAIGQACRNRLMRVATMLEPCSPQEAARITELLEANGYCVNRRDLSNSNKSWFEIRWEEAE